MVDAQSLGKEGTEACRQSALGALHSLSSPTSVQEVSLEREVGSETWQTSSGAEEMLQEVSWTPNPTLPIGSRAKPSLSQAAAFQLQKRNQQEKETQRAEHPHIPRSSGTTSVPTPLFHVCPNPSQHGQAESPHLSTILLPHCCLLLPFLWKAPTVIHGFMLFQYDLARAKDKNYDMKWGTFLLQESQLRSPPSYNPALENQELRGSSSQYLPFAFLI